MLYKSKYYASICRIIEKLIDVNLVNDDVNLVNDMYFDFDYSDKSYLRYICFTKSARISTLHPFFVFFLKISIDSLITGLQIQSVTMVFLK